MLPCLERFQPQLIIWACGFDAVEGDSLAGTKLSPRGYFRIASHLRKACGGTVPLAVVLEGGYSPERIAESARNVVEALLTTEGNSSKSLEPLKAAFPRPNVDFSAEHSHRLTPLNLPWRPLHSGLCRPEAVLEGCRRNLNRLWGEKVLLEVSFEEDDEVSVEIELQWLDEQLENCAFNRESGVMTRTDCEPKPKAETRVRKPSAKSRML